MHHDPPALQQLVQQMESNPEYAGVRGVDNPQCSIAEAVANTAAAYYRADLTYNNGSEGAIGIFIKVWKFEDGVTLMLRAITDEPILSGYISHWNNFGVYEKGTASQTLTSGCAAKAQNGVEY